ncbi:MAG: PadR family transcriptional regulator [Frankia sp.]
MREPTFLVLSALADAPRHGYGVMREVLDMSHGRVRLRTSTLYAALERLLADGLVAEAGREAVDGRLRRYYALTDPGRERLAAEVDRLTANATEARRRLQLRAATT